MSFRIFALLLLTALFVALTACSTTPPVRQEFADAAAAGKIDKVKDMVEYKNVSPNATDRKGYSALQHATNRGYFDVVQYLGNKEADTKYLDPGKATALHHAAFKGHMELVRYLVETKADDVNLQTEKGYTPLERAAFGGHTDVVKFLISKNADPTIASATGDTPLHVAAFNGNTEIVKYLASLDKVDSNAKESRGFTPLHYAVYNNHDDCVIALIEDGADVNAISNDGLSVLAIAEMTQNKKVIKALKDKGAIIPAAAPAPAEESTPSEDAGA